MWLLELLLVVVVLLLVVVVLLLLLLLLYKFRGDSDDCCDLLNVLYFKLPNGVLTLPVEVFGIESTMEVNDVLILNGNDDDVVS